MPDGGRAENEQLSSDEFGISAVRELLRLISETDITEIQIELAGRKLHIKRGIPAQHPTFMVTPSLAAGLSPASNGSPQSAASLAPPSPQSSAAASPAAVPAEVGLAPGSQAITAPMVGTFYAGPSPKDPPYVQEGDTVQPNEVVGIIEAMKIMNEIVFEGEAPGRVARILVSNGQPVEYGQSLMIIEPSQ